MFLRLTEKSPFWSLVDENTRELLVHLTFQNPGPVELDYDSLKDHHKKVVAQGLSLRYIEQVVMEEPKEEPVEEVVTEEPIGAEDRRVETQLLTAEQLLAKGVRGVRDELRDAPYGAEFLTRAISVEKEGKNRVTVVQALEQKINKLGGAGAVEESDEEEITIQYA
jgi:hypothetical protein